MLISGLVFVAWIFCFLVSVTPSGSSKSVVALDCLGGKPSDTLLGVATGVSGRMHFGYWKLTLRMGVHYRGPGSKHAHRREGSWVCHQNLPWAWGTEEGEATAGGLLHRIEMGGQKGAGDHLSDSLVCVCG